MQQGFGNSARNSSTAWVYGMVPGIGPLLALDNSA